MKSYGLSVVCLATMFMLGERALAEEKPLKVFVLAGQSNMRGRRAKVSEIPGDLKGEQKEVLFFGGRQWTPLAPGKTEKQGFGPEISFARGMSEKLNEPIGTIKHSVGGSSLAVRWSPSDPKSLYAQLVKKVEAARKSRRIKIVGMLWMQGERDARDRKMAGAYAPNLAALIEAARKDFKSPDMFFIAGRVNPPKRGYRFVDVVRKAQEECRASNYAFIDCDALQKGPDNLHYTTEGYVEMGYRFADGAFRLLKRTKTR